MAKVVMYSTRFCGYCMHARRLLEGKGVAFTEIMVDADPAKRVEMMQLSGRRSVPQIFIDDEPVGGFTDLLALDRAGDLDAMLQKG